MTFFQTFSCVFLRLFKSFLPAISSFPQQFPQFSLGFPSLPLFFFLQFNVFFTIFLHFPPFFATLRHSFLGITPHPLANCLAPNPNGRCSSLSFGPLVFSIYSCLYVPSFFKALPCLHFMFFFKPFPAFPRFFQSFLFIFPTVSSISLVFPSLPFIFFFQFNVFFTIFHHFPPLSHCFFNDFPSFSLVFSYLFPSVLRGPRGNRTPPSPNCLVVHAPLKNPIGHPYHHPISRFRCTWATSPHTPYTHFVRENNFA